MLSRAVEAHCFGGENILSESVRRRRSHAPVRPIALVEHKLEFQRLIVKVQLVALRPHLAQRKIALYRVRRFSVLPYSQVKPV